MDKFQSKSAIDKKKAEEGLDPYADFDGSPGELFFLKLSHFIGKNRKSIGIGFLVLFASLAGVIGFLEFRDNQRQSATAKFEEMEVLLQRQMVGVDQRIQAYEAFLLENPAIELRLWKELSKLHSDKGDWSTAASYLEKSAKQIDEPKEMKAYYFGMAGVYRDAGGELELSLQNLEIASSLLETNLEVPSFKAWLNYHLGRVQILTGKKESGIENLKKVLLAEPKSESQLAEIKTKASYLILKTQSEVP